MERPGLLFKNRTLCLNAIAHYCVQICDLLRQPCLTQLDSPFSNTMPYQIPCQNLLLYSKLKYNAVASILIESAPLPEVYYSNTRPGPCVRGKTITFQANLNFHDNNETFDRPFHSVEEWTVETYLCQHKSNALNLKMVLPK